MTSNAARQASPALSGSTAKSTPMAMPCRGRKPANQYTSSPRAAVRTMITTSRAVTHAAAAMATLSSARRRVRNTGVSAEIPAATMSGMITTRVRS